MGSLPASSSGSDGNQKTNLNWYSLEYWNVPRLFNGNTNVQTETLGKTTASRGSINDSFSGAKEGTAQASPGNTKRLAPSERLRFNFTPLFMESPARQVYRAFLIIYDALREKMRQLTTTDISKSLLPDSPSLHCLYDIPYLTRQWIQQGLHTSPILDQKEKMLFILQTDNPREAYSYAVNHDHFLHNLEREPMPLYARFLRGVRYSFPFTTLGSLRNRIFWASKILKKHAGILFDHEAMMYGMDQASKWRGVLRRDKVLGAIHSRTHEIIVVDESNGVTLSPEGNGTIKCHVLNGVRVEETTPKSSDPRWGDRKIATKGLFDLLITFTELYRQVFGALRLAKTMVPVGDRKWKHKTQKERENAWLEAIKHRTSKDTIPLLTYPKNQVDLAKWRSITKLDGGAPWSDRKATEIKMGQLLDFSTPLYRWENYRNMAWKRYHAKRKDEDTARAEFVKDKEYKSIAKSMARAILGNKKA